MLQDTYSGMTGLNSQMLGAIGGGMDQFYGSLPKSGSAFPGYRDTLSSGWGDVGSAYGTANSGVRNMWDSSLGKRAIFQTPLEREKATVEARNYATANRPRSPWSRMQLSPAPKPAAKPSTARIL
jgi:hypothetical protein